MQKLRTLNFEAPRTEIEYSIIQIWSDVLEIPPGNIGIRDNFFNLGGDSLSLTQVMNRVNEIYSLDLTISTLFLSPDIKSICRVIKERAGACEKHIDFPFLDRKKALPVSVAQEGLWFLDELLGSNAFLYNTPAALHISGRLNIRALHKAFISIISRHEILRTTFKKVRNESGIFQVIADNLHIELPVVKATQEEVNKYIQENSRHVFELTYGPLIRLCLLQLTEQTHILLVNMHHMITDGWSAGVLIKELTVLYSSYCKGSINSLPPLPVQYADYAYWQRQWLLQDEQKKKVEYWCEKLKGFPQRLEFPHSGLRSLEQCYRGSSMCFLLSRNLLDRLNILALEEGVTMFMILLAALKILLSKYTNQEDIIVGTPVANRNRPVLEDLIGFFVNIIVLRDYVDAGCTFRDFLKQVKHTSLEAYENQDIPFEHLVKVINPVRNNSHSPLFQVMFILQNLPVGRIEIEDLEVDWIEQSSEVSKYDLTLELTEKQDCMVGKVEYSTYLFSSSFIKKMVRHYEVLLDGIVGNPGQQISRLPLLSKAEYIRILQEVNTINPGAHETVKI